MYARKTSVPVTRRTQAGQALTEALIFAALAGVMAILVLTLGRLQSLNTHVIDAAHSFAFECRLLEARCDSAQAQAAIVAALRERHFSLAAVGAANDSGRVFEPISSATPLQSFWRNHDGSPMVPGVESIAMTARAIALDAGINTAVAGRGGVAQALGQYVGPQRFGLDPRGGLRLAEVEVPVSLRLGRDARGPQEPVLALTLRAKLAAVGDEWNATSTYGPQSDSLASRVERGRRLDAARESTLQAGYALTRGSLGLFELFGFEPNAASLLDHRLDVGIVPQDRRP